MIKEINDFASLFGSSLSLNEELVVKKQNRCFLLNEVLKKGVSKDFFCAGIYLGKTVGGRLFPGFELLRLLAEKKSNKSSLTKRLSGCLSVEETFSNKESSTLPALVRKVTTFWF